jgi:NitT/TauT family transport system substrate-binding protein
MGVSGLKGATQLMVEALLTQAGMKPTDVTFVNVGVGQASAAALNKGAVDMLAAFPFLSLQLSANTTKVFDQVVEGPEAMSKQASTVWMAKADWLEENKETAQTLCDVWRDATAYMKDPANAEEVAGVLADRHGLSADEAELALAENGPLSVLTADVDCEAVDNLLDSTRAAGGIPAGVDATCEDLLWQS